MTDNKLAEKMIAQYANKPMSKAEEIKMLDKKVKMPVKVFAYVFGIIGSLILGTGMCLAMKVIGDSTIYMIVGIVVGIIGIILVSITYAIYCKLLSNRKKKYSEEIIKKSNELLEQN